MTSRKIAALYAIVVGVSTLAVWGLFGITGTVFGVKPEPVGIPFHIAAEIFISATMIAAGIGLLKKTAWGVNMYFLALGTLLYAVINAPGLYIKNGGMPIVGMFACIFIFGVIFCVVGFHIKDNE